MNAYFSQDFLTTSSKNISDEISKNSFFYMKSILNEDFTKKIISETKLFDPKFNSLEVSSVHDHDGYYMSNGLAKSQALFDLLTSSEIINISEQYLGKKFRLKCHRVYSVGSGTKNPWHTDDKKYGEKNDKIKGLVFIIYLNDVFEGEFQAIKGSHLFSENFKYPNFDTHLMDEYKDSITSFKMPKGSIVIFDNKAIHRAKPYLNFFWRRKSLFFQIDNEIEDGEKIIVKTEFLKNLSNNQSMLLGMGKPSNMPHEPSKTGINTINFKMILNLQIEIFKAIFFRTFHFSKFLLNDKVKRYIQKIYKKKIKINTK
jgi:ectoine hydroxylase-related dioxygenase (phytanoyl-CoA dioxygenase family)